MPPCAFVRRMPLPAVPILPPRGRAEDLVNWPQPVVRGTPVAGKAVLGRRKEGRDRWAPGGDATPSEAVAGREGRRENLVPSDSSRAPFTCFLRRATPRQ